MYIVHFNFEKKFGHCLEIEITEKVMKKRKQLSSACEICSFLRLAEPHSSSVPSLFLVTTRQLKTLREVNAPDSRDREGTSSLAISRVVRFDEMEYGWKPVHRGQFQAKSTKVSTVTHSRWEMARETRKCNFF